MRIFFICTLMCLISLSASADERILSYHSDIEVFVDGSMQVIETITVRAEGDQIKRGIYRDFPTEYQDRFGNRLRVEFFVLSVSRDGKTEVYRTEPKRKSVRVYIGQSHVFLVPGVYRYALTYRTNRQLGYFEDHDELYWNVTGNGWNFPIDQASATITLPETFSSAELAGAEAYTGYAGEQGRDYDVSTDLSGRVIFHTTRPLNKAEGLSIVVTWPKGYVYEPSAREKFNNILNDNSTWLVALLGLGLLIIYYFLVWRLFGRDPEQGNIFPHYAPPRGYSPASLRYVNQMGYDHRTFVVALINLAVKGLVSIHDDGGEFTLKQTDKALDDLAAGEKTLLNKLFSGQSREIELTQSNHKQIGMALKAHSGALQRDYEKHYFVTNKYWIIPGILISLVTYVAVLVQLTDEEQITIAAGLSFWLALWTVGVFALLKKVWVAWSNYHSVIDLFPALVITAFAAPFVGAEFLVIGLLGTQITPAIPAVLIVAVAVNIIFYTLLKAPTLTGRKLLDRIEGFKLYLNVAEKDELNLRTPPDKTPQLFERFLPYALALDVELRWTERFADCFAQLVNGDESYRPGWYHGRAWNSHRPMDFSANIGGSLSSAVSISSKAPGSSSGSGGGGSSGGGGGGGGGGGW